MKKLFFSVFLLTMLIAGAAYTGQSRAVEPVPKGVDLLRGRWTGILVGQDPEGNHIEFPFDLRIVEGAKDAENEEKLLVTGCMSIGESPMVPAAGTALVNESSPTDFDLTLATTNLMLGGVNPENPEEFWNAPIQWMGGHLAVSEAQVTDDTISNSFWQSADLGGDWDATIHHDRRKPKCPTPDLSEGGLFFNADLYTIHNRGPEGQPEVGTIFESYTNIVSGGVLATSPTGEEIFMPGFTDLFSPQVDFTSEFRYLTDRAGEPVLDESYTFTLLDVTGQPIAGAQAVDVYGGCYQDAPMNGGLAVGSEGLTASWDPVAPAPGFNPTPGVEGPFGFYQIELVPVDEGQYGLYGAGSILSTSHLMPFAPFDPGVMGIPDGWDFGESLDSIPDGQYALDIISFANEPLASAGVGLACQKRDPSQSPRFEKANGEYLIVE